MKCVVVLALLAAVPSFTNALCNEIYRSTVDANPRYKTPTLQYLESDENADLDTENDKLIADKGVAGTAPWAPAVWNTLTYAITFKDHIDVSYDSAPIQVDIGHCRILAYGLMSVDYVFTVPVGHDGHNWQSLQRIPATIEITTDNVVVFKGIQESDDIYHRERWEDAWDAVRKDPFTLFSRDAKSRVCQLSPGGPRIECSDGAAFTRNITAEADILAAWWANRTPINPEEDSQCTMDSIQAGVVGCPAMHARHVGSYNASALYLELEDWLTAASYPDNTKGRVQILSIYENNIVYFNTTYVSSAVWSVSYVAPDLVSFVTPSLHKAQIQFDRESNHLWTISYKSFDDYDETVSADSTMSGNCTEASIPTVFVCNKTNNPHQLSGGAVLEVISPLWNDGTETCNPADLVVAHPCTGGGKFCPAVPNPTVHPDWDAAWYWNAGSLVAIAIGLVGILWRMFAHAVPSSRKTK